MPTLNIINIKCKILLWNLSKSFPRYFKSEKLGQQNFYLEEEKKLYATDLLGYLCCFQIEQSTKKVELIEKFELTNYLRDSEITEMFVQRFFDHFFVLLSNCTLLKFTLNLEFISAKKISDETKKIIASKINQMEETLVLFFSDGILKTLNKNFEAENEVSIFEGTNPEHLVSADLSWRPDSKCFSLSYQVPSGRKVVSFSNSLLKIQSKTLYNPEYELVTNVFETASPNLREINVWARNGGGVYGVISPPNKPTLTEALICWEVNGLLYKKFDVCKDIKDGHMVKQLSFNQSSDVLALVTQKEDNNYLWLFLRSNSNWFPKSKINLKFTSAKILSFEKEMTILCEFGLMFFDFSLTNDLFDYHVPGFAN